MPEIWKDIEGFEGMYQVSNEGRVISLPRKRVRNMRFMTPNKTKIGYLIIRLRKNGKLYGKSIHRLVAKAFVDGRTDIKKEVNHIDCNKENNHWTNLEWVTRSENMIHARGNGRLNNKR